MPVRVRPSAPSIMQAVSYTNECCNKRSDFYQAFFVCYSGWVLLNSISSASRHNPNNSVYLRGAGIAMLRRLPICRGWIMLCRQSIKGCRSRLTMNTENNHRDRRVPFKCPTQSLHIKW